MALAVTLTGHTFESERAHKNINAATLGQEQK
jgi:hypothetical protein